MCETYGKTVNRLFFTLVEIKYILHYLKFLLYVLIDFFFYLLIIIYVVFSLICLQIRDNLQKRGVVVGSRTHL